MATSKKPKEGQKYKKLEKKTHELEDIRKALMNMLEDVEAAKQEAEREKNKTLAIIANFADGLLVFNADHRIALINPQAEKILKVEGKDVKKKNIIDLSIIPYLKPLADFLQREGRVITRRELKMGDTTLEVSSVLVEGGTEDFRTIVILHDITREKTIESMKTEFVSLTAHQLRTPLSAIKWTLTMLLDGDMGAVSQEQKDLLTKTYQSNERMIALISDLLDVARIEEGRYVSDTAFVDLEEVVQFVLKNYTQILKRKKLKLDFKRPRPKLPKTALDVEKIRLVIQNLLENAIRYTPEGGKIIISLKGTPKEIEFQIQDSGIGIPRDQQKRIFTKFFRSVNAVKFETEGSGLGLFLAKNIIKAHQGRIWFESQLNKGTTFYFSLPVKKQFEEFLKEF